MLRWFGIAAVLIAGTLFCNVTAALHAQSKDDAGECLFRVGAFDGSSAEFAQGKPSGDVTYTVGRSIAAKDWYAFQAAVLYRQAGTSERSTASPRRIEFEVRGPLSASYQFKASLLFELQSVPSLRIAINGKSGMFYPEAKRDDRMGDTAGAYDPIYANADISFAFPGSFLHTGLNTLTLQAVEEADDAVPGGGFKYDAIELDSGNESSVDRGLPFE